MSCELFVGNLNPEVRMRDLENCYGRYGKIIRCDLKKNFGFIQFEDRRDAEEAIRKENNRRLLGSVMTVEWAKGSVGDKSGFRGGGPGFRKPRSPNRFAGRVGGRERSPFGGGRARSPMGRGRDRSPMNRGGNFASMPPRARGFSPREDRYSGGGRHDSFDSSPRFENSRPGRDRLPPRERFNSSDRFNDRGGNRGPPPSDRGNRGPPPRENGFSDRPRGGDRFNDRRDNFGERRSFSGPRRF